MVAPDDNIKHSEDSKPRNTYLKYVLTLGNAETRKSYTSSRISCSIKDLQGTPNLFLDTESFKISSSVVILQKHRLHIDMG